MVWPKHLLPGSSPVSLAKRELRSWIRFKRKWLPGFGSRAEASEVCAEVVSTEEWRKAQTVGLYMSQAKELNLNPLAEAAFSSGKRVFFPRCISGSEMVMLEAFGMEDIRNFPGHPKWGIQEPEFLISRNRIMDHPASNPNKNTSDRVEVGENEPAGRACDGASQPISCSLEGTEFIERPNAMDSGLDLLIVPGMAFDRYGGRLGYGRGFYDRYIQHLRERFPKQESNPENPRVPTLFGVAFSSQLLWGRIPREEHDIGMDRMFWSSKRILPNLLAVLLAFVCFVFVLSFLN